MTITSECADYSGFWIKENWRCIRCVMGDLPRAVQIWAASDSVESL